MKNILIKGNNVRIADFGESKVIKINSGSLTGIKGSETHLPPELLFLDEFSKVKASCSHDIWSLGILAYQIFSDGNHPFKKPSSTELDWKNDVKLGKYIIDSFISQDSPIYQIIKGII